MRCSFYGRFKSRNFGILACSSAEIKAVEPQDNQANAIASLQTKH
ncbi:hypothetical protein [Gloeocapsa sp. PCC 7428]|nr:hypothetical protein [Gloeocapsa sp. PCC 7428]